MSTGVVYLVAVLRRCRRTGDSGWACSRARRRARSAFNFFHIPPTGRFTIADPENWVALAVYLRRGGDRLARWPSCAVAGGRGRAPPARRPTSRPRWREILLGGASLRGRAGRGVAPARRRRSACRASRSTLDGSDSTTAAPRIAARRRRGDGRRARPADRHRRRRSSRALRERVVPSLEALLRAALDRDALQAEVVETAALRRIGRDQDRAAAGRVARPAHAADRDHRRRRRRCALADARRRRARRARRAGRGGGRAPGASRRAAARPLRAAGGRRDAAARLVLDRGGGPRGASSSSAGATAGADRARPSTATCRCFEADAAQLERVFVNLLENARRYSGGEPVIGARAARSGGCVKVRVVDRGPGIAAGAAAADLRAVLPPAGQPTDTRARGSAWRSSRASSRPTAAGCGRSRCPARGRRSRRLPGRRAAPAARDARWRA